MMDRTTWRWVALAAAIAGAVLWLASFGGMDRGLVMRGYLFAYMFALGLGMGSVSMLLLQNSTGGTWGAAVRPALQRAAMTVPLLAVLFVPIALNLPALFPWARGDAHTHELLAHRAPYLNAPFFLARAAAYFAIWIWLAWVVWRGRPIHRGLSSAGLIIYLMTMTQAGFDWVLSRETEFHSTAFGFVITLGQNLAAFAFAILCLPRRKLQPQQPPALSHRPGLFNDIGNITLVLVILWMYVSFMELLVIWMGNSREDNAWYLHRGFAGLDADSIAWRWVGAAIIVGHFFVPFYLLLFRSLKRSGTMLAVVAWILLAAHVLVEYWLVAGSGAEGRHFNPGWGDAGAFLGVVGLWLFVALLMRTSGGTEGPATAPEASSHG
jgi:hypothetical protein